LGTPFISRLNPKDGGNKKLKGSTPKTGARLNPKDGGNKKLKGSTPKTGAIRN